MIDQIKVMIVEDQDLIAADIASKLKKHKMIVTGIYNTGEKAIAALDNSLPDLILMDIKLAGVFDGISTTGLIREKYEMPVIYLTDHVDQSTVERASKTLPANYLAKPFFESDLIRAITIAIANANAAGIKNQNHDHFFIKVDTGHVKIAFDDIFWIEAAGAYCKIFTADKSFVQSISLNHVHEQLPANRFMRVHRSHVVNLSKVTGLDGNVLILGSHKVEVSKSMREELLQKLNFLR